MSLNERLREIADPRCNTSVPAEAYTGEANSAVQAHHYGRKSARELTMVERRAKLADVVRGLFQKAGQ